MSGADAGGNAAPPPPLTSPAWGPGPDRPALPRGQVHVWRADLDDPGWTVAACLALVDAAERERASRLLQPRYRARFTASRAALRTVLGRYVSIDTPAALAFAVGPSGKPALEGVGSDIGFNLSHSAGVALVAVARACEVGIDVERERPGVRIDEIARRQFHPDVVRALLALDPPHRPAAFLRCWCALEARLKAAGTGFAAGAGMLDELGLPERMLATLEARSWTGVAGRWRVSALDAGAGYAAVVAVDASAVQSEDGWLTTFQSVPAP